MEGFNLEAWNVEAGQAYFDETVTGVQKAVEEAGKVVKGRSAERYRKEK
jgi:hypothetical protein